MFVRPEQVAALAARHPELRQCRLVVKREGEADVMTLLAETAESSQALLSEVTASLKAILKLSGTVEFVPVGTLPHDGKVIDDTRPVS